MAKKTKRLDDLFHDTLKDIYYAEKKILTALPKMNKAAQSPDLKAAFRKHEGETKGRLGALNRSSRSLGPSRRQRSATPSTVSPMRAKKS